MKKVLFILLVLAVACSLVYAQENSFDSLVMKPYNKTLDAVGTVLQFTSLASAGLLAFEDPSEYVTIGTMYLETVGLTYLSKELIKTFVSRNRPYTYFDGAPVEDSDEWARSFPSGHTALAFAGASFTSYVFSKYKPDSQWRVPVCAACSAVAVATAVTRVAAGCHFMTDVLAGALLGTACGLGVPLLHTIGENSGAEIALSPFSLLISFDL